MTKPRQARITAHGPAKPAFAGYAPGSWSGRAGAGPSIPVILERFPHIVDKVTHLWGTPELDAYLKGLLLDTRDGQRRGFTLAEASAINGLIDGNFELIKTVGDQGTDPYNFNPYLTRF